MAGTGGFLGLLSGSNPWGAAIGGGLGLLSTAGKFLFGKSQADAARAIEAKNPGYEMNRGVIDNARTANENYTNYGLPGYSKILDNLNQSYQGGMNTATQGATSSGDVLDAANKLSYNQDQALNGLALQEAQGKNSARQEFMTANAAAGQEQVNKNAYDRDIFQQQLGRQQQLTDASVQNRYGAVDQAGRLVSSMLAYRPKTVTPGSGLNIGAANSIFDAYNTVAP